VAEWVWDFSYDEKKRRVRRFKLVIRRSHTPPTSYTIDGERAKKEEVVKAARAYNIQVDNPCVFLAQDKVASFAEQTPIQKLKNTEKVGLTPLSLLQPIPPNKLLFQAGPVELLKLHEEMEEMVGEGNDFEANVERQKRRLTETRKNKERVKPRRDNYLRMVEMKGRIDLLEKRRRQLEYEARIAHLHEAEEEAKAVDQAYKEAQRRVNPLEGKIEQAKVAKGKIEMGLEKTVCDWRE